MSRGRGHLPTIQPPPSPAGPENDRAVRHGAYSDSLVVPRARELMPAVFEANPHLDPARDAAGVARYCVKLTRIERAYEWLAARRDPVFSDARRGRVWPLYERLERWERQADADEQRLAIAPLTRARLGLAEAAAFDLAMHWAAEQDGDGGGG